MLILQVQAQVTRLMKIDAVAIDCLTTKVETSGRESSETSLFLDSLLLSAWENILIIHTIHTCTVLDLPLISENTSTWGVKSNWIHRLSAKEFIEKVSTIKLMVLMMVTSSCTILHICILIMISGILLSIRLVVSIYKRAWELQVLLVLLHQLLILG